MLKLNDVRAFYPQYENVTDYELSRAVHRSRYAGMPYEQFAQSFGAPLEEDKAEIAAREFNAANPKHSIAAQDIRDKDRSGLFGGIRLLGEGIYDAVTDQFPEDMARAWRGGDIDPTNSGLADSIIKRQTKDSAARIPSLQEAEGDILANSLYQGPRSIATSVATALVGSAAGGAAGSAFGPVGTVLGGMVGGAAMSGAAFYRMAKDQFVDEVQQAMQRSMGRAMTSEEAAELNRAIDADATEFGLWEAGPEAVSQFFTLGLIKGAGGTALKKLGMGVMSDSIGKRALTRIPTKMAAELTEEETTEGTTYFGQEGIRQRYGLRPDAPSLGEFAREQAGPVAVGSLLQLGGMRGAYAIGNRMRRRAESTGDAETDETMPADTPPSGGGSQEHTGRVEAVPPASATDSAAFGTLTGPEWDAPKAPFDEAAWNREAAERGWSHYRTDLPGETGGGGAALSEHDRSAWRSVIQIALDRGDTVDLLTLPQDATGLAQGIGILALPPGTGAMPMPTQQTGMPPIAPPTTFSGAPLATPYAPRLALPQQSGPSAGVGRWGGGRSQLAYGNGMMQGLGFMGEQPSPRQAPPAPALPTQAQITGTQQDPRADTMATAEGLGIPAPDSRPAEARTAPQAAQPAVSPTAPAQVEPAWSYGVPSFVTAPHRQTLPTPPAVAPFSPAHAGRAKASRAELLQQLPPEQRKDARRMTNAQLEERVLAEQNPVPFDKDSIDYTVEDYPMPTAPGGTVFTSASGRKLAPFPQVDYSTPHKRKASNAKVAQWLIDEAQKEAAPNEWRSLLIRRSKADNLSPADVDDLVDILSSGVEAETIPPQLKQLKSSPQAAEQRQIQPSEDPAGQRSSGQAHGDEQRLPSARSKGVEGTASTDQQAKADLGAHFAAQFLQEKSYANIGQARREAATISGTKVAAGTTAVKNLDENIELGIVKASREIISSMRKQGASDVEIFRRMVRLYGQQPNLSVRTSTSVAQQAYSTPAPLAFLASHLAGITNKTMVYEPTAGNGILLMAASPQKSIVNELNAERAERLRSLGFTVNEGDAAEFLPKSEVDVVIANPPFGRVHDDSGTPLSWDVAGYETKELDHAIALKALEAMQPQGRAVIIIGGKQGSEATRSSKYQATAQRQFYRALFDHYKVVDHFTVDGKMYERQGAGYPVDFIVIDGKGYTEGRKFPAASLPRIYDNFQSLEELIDEQRPAIHESVDAERRGRISEDSGIRGGHGNKESGGSYESAVPVGALPAAELHTGGSGRPGRSSAQAGDVQPGTERGQAGGSGLRADRHTADGGRQLSGAPEQQDGLVRDRVSEQDGGERGSVARPSRPEPERLVGEAGPPVSGKLVEKSRPQQIAQKATALQEPYTPHSAVAAMGTLTPRNMASPLKAALEDLETRHGDIDAYVGSELGYSPKELKKYFAGEQIDAIGLAIDNLSKGSGFIIGDQTGIGKGRVNAAIIRYARQKGLIPVFVTMKPDLYADMIRDLNDIGETSFNPLPTNGGLTGEKAIPLPDGRLLRTKESAKHRSVLAKAADNGVADFDAVFTTYDQLNPGKTEERRTFMMNIAPRALFILDESHNAGGSDSGQKRKGKEAQQSRAAFVREMLAASPHGVFYSSATYAKRPDVMSLYFKTDMRHAVDDIGALSDAISAGGIPLQQVVAAQLTESGQYIRRERSFEGASVEVTPAKADLNHAEQSATIMRGILAFDKVKQLAMKEKAAEAMAQGEAVGDSSATGEKGANSTNFTSIMHNLIGQSLLGMKAQAAVDEAASAVERGEKPVLTLANTMGSFISEHVKNNDVRAGQELNISFKDLFRRYLDKTRTLTRKGSNDKVIESRLLTDSELGPDGVAAYRAALEAIDGSTFADLPISPIDFITTELERKGISVGEITGRNHAVEYRDGTPYYRTRKTSSAQNIETMRKFNNGELDVMILNQSGSTGISLHSSSTFTDQRKRTMIIVQPELNIDVFMQTLGRVFRTGQVTPPAYKLLSSDIPAEKRPAAVLGKKMAGLNANTTASRKTDTTFQNIPDFLNQYGDAVAAQIMEEDPELHAALGNPLPNDEKGLSREDAVRKVTGRIPMLPLKEQQELYERIESDYNALIAQLEATGGAALEAKTLQLDARLLESHELTTAREGAETSVFGSSSRLGLFDVKVLGKPYTPERVSAMVKEGKENTPDLAALRTNTREWLQKKMEAIENDETKESLRARTNEQFSRVHGVIESYPVGEPVRLSTFDAVFDGIVTRVEYKGKGNPSAPSAWRMTVAVADAAKQITIPFSKLTMDSGEISIGGAFIRANGQSVASTLEKFARGQTAKREKRYIAFGNVLSAYASAGNSGQVVNFEDSEGNVRPGILFRKDSSRDSILGTSAVSFPDFAAISAFFAATDNKAIVKSADGNLVLSASGDTFKISVPASKAKGAQFFLNGKLLEATGQDFVKSGNSMVVNVDKATAAKMVGVLREQGYGLVAGSHKDEARTVMGMDAEQSLASLARGAESKPVRVVEVDPGIVPDFKKMRDLASWLKNFFADKREETILSTGKRVRFGNTNLEASMKRAREQAHSKAYGGLNDLVRLAEYDSFKANDARHPNLGGQESYYSAMRLGDNLYAVKFKFDVPGNAEIAYRKGLDRKDNIEDLRYKDHSLREIEIAPILYREPALKGGIHAETGAGESAPVLYRGVIPEGRPAQTQSAIREVSLSVLKGAVNPSALENGVLSSIFPGQFLPPRKPVHIAARRESIERVAKKLGERAKHAAPVRVVADASELPDSIRRQHADNLDTIEGAYDTRSKTVWLVAGNLSSDTRAAEVWAHEQFVHHGLRGLFTDAERRRLLGQIWTSIGGMRNQAVREVADLYGLDPRSDLKTRLTVMEEVIASMAEKRAMDSMTPQEMTVWKRIVNAVLRAWNNLVLAVSGRSGSMGFENVDQLLSYLGEYVMDGKMSSGHEGSVAEDALSSLRASRSDAVTDDAPLASLSPHGILGMTVRGAEKAANAPEIRHLFKKDDIEWLQGIVRLPHWIAKNHPDFAKVYERQLKRLDERSAALKASLETVPSLFGGYRLKAADMRSLRSLLWEQEGKEPKELEGVEKFLVEDTLVTGRKIIKANPEFYTAYKSWLDGLPGTNAAKSAMLEIRKSLDQDLVQAHNRMAAMSEVSDDTIKEFRQSIGHVPNYFPYHRYGAYFVQAKVGAEVVFRQHFDALGEKAAMAKARKIVEEQRANYPDAEWADGKNDRLPDEVLGAPIDSEAMEQIIRAATSKIGDKERAREINELLAEGVSDVLKSRGWGAHGIQRKGVPGFETEDIARVLYDYKAGLNGWLTKMEAAKDFSAALSKIDARRTPGMWKYTSQYVKDMLRNSDRIDRVTGNIKAVAFVWYLGGSIKTAFVNATQNIVVGVPRLQMDVMGGGTEWLAGARDAIVDRVTGNKGKGLADDEARLIHELYGESIITDAFMEEVRGQLRGISGATMWNKFTKALGWPMSEVERFNRASLALAAFRAARSGKLKARAREKYGVKGKASYEQAKEFATDVVRDAHFVYGKSNMPEFMRSNAAGRSMASMYTFRTFSHNMIDMWTWALKSQGKEGAAFVAKSLGATMALGGVTALPLYATLMALFQAATGDDDDWTEKIRSWLPQNNLLRDVVCYGIPAMAGVNIRGSLKMETPLTKGLTAGKTPQEVLADSIGDIIGIPYDLLVVKPSRMLDANRKGNTWRVLEEAAPVSLKNAMQAWRLYSDGHTTMTGRPINDPGKRGARKLSGGEAMGKFLGFQPVSSAKSYDAYAADKHSSQVRSDKIDELTVMALKTVDTGNPAGRQEMSRELRAWNEKMKAEGKPHMLIQPKDVMRRVKSRRRENRVNAKTLQKKTRMEAVWG